MNKFDDLRKTTQDILIPIRIVLFGTQAATAGNYGVIDNIPFNCTLVSASESHAVAGNDAGAVTLDLEKLTGTQAPGAGVSVMSSTWNLKGAINTVVAKKPNNTINSNIPNRYFKKGDRLALLLSGTPTAVGTVVVVAIFKIYFNQLPIYIGDEVI